MSRILNCFGIFVMAGAAIFLERVKRTPLATRIK